MFEMSTAEFISLEDEFDRAVAQTPDIDRFCSSSLWIVPAHRAFLPDHRLWIQRSEYGFVALASGTDVHLGTYLHPLEASWALACPLVGAQAAALTREFVRTCRESGLRWNLLFLSGISPASIHFRELVRGFRRDYSLGLGASSTRRVASLSGGVDGFLARRSTKFRANLRRARRRAADSGIEYEYITRIDGHVGAARLLERALRIERRSWKGESDTGIIDEPMKTFYQVMLPMLAERNLLRFMFVRLDGVDIAYCFGGVFEATFRGLQMSFDVEYRQHSPGSLAQLAMIERLCEEGVQGYDLGSDMEYKRQWAEEGLETVALIVRR